MKRTTALLLAAILCLCLAACGKAPEPEQSPQEPHTEANDTEGTEEKPQSGSSPPTAGTRRKSRKNLFSRASNGLGRGIWTVKRMTSPRLRIPWICSPDMESGAQVWRSGATDR